MGDLDVEDRRVLLRVDFDVPLSLGSALRPAEVTEDAPLRAALVTIEELRRRGARVIVVSHVGRPHGPDPAWSMRPVAERLASLTGASVPLAPGVVGSRVRELTEQMLPGEMMMLENVRFEPGELRNAPSLALALAELADLYVDDAFAAAHRAYASNEGVARLLPSAAGPLMEREVYALSALVERPARPLVAVLGGVGLRHKLGVLRRFLALADTVCLGGALCLPFLAASGHGVGRSRCPEEDLAPAGEILVAAAATGRLALPEDLVLAAPNGSAAPRELDGVDVPEGAMALDIGARTTGRYDAAIFEAATVFWSGPMGRSEVVGFDAGTRSIANAIASSSAMSVVTGEDTVQALRSYGLEDRMSYVTTAGQAAFDLLEGRQLPAIQALRPASVAVR